MPFLLHIEHFLELFFPGRGSIGIPPAGFLPHGIPPKRDSSRTVERAITGSPATTQAHWNAWRRGELEVRVRIS